MAGEVTRDRYGRARRAAQKPILKDFEKTVPVAVLLPQPADPAVPQEPYAHTMPSRLIS
jgi:hypothetical protein